MARFMLTSQARDALGLLALAIVLLVVDLTITGHFHRNLALQAIIFAIAAVGLTLLLGFAGQVSLGQNAFVAIGAYALGNMVQKVGLHPLPALAVSALLPAIVGYAVSRPILRLSGHYLALATLALGASAYIFASQWTSVTGGLDPGIVDLPKLALVPGLERDQLFTLAALCLLAVMGFSLLLVHSPVGRSLQAICTSETVAAGAGIRVDRTKAAIFALAAAFAGLSGGLYALFMRSFNATSFSILLSIELLMMVIVGSLSTIWGALVGALLVVLLPHMLEHFEAAKLFIYGAIMTLVVMFMPNGLASTLFAGVNRLLRGDRAR